MSRHIGGGHALRRGSSLCQRFGRRQVVITEIRDDGRAGLLRFLDNGQVQWALCAQFLNSEKWIPIGMKEAAK
jgi:hypothetical protein